MSVSVMLRCRTGDCFERLLWAGTRRDLDLARKAAHSLKLRFVVIKTLVHP